MYNSDTNAGRELDALIAEKVMKTFIPAGSNPTLRDDAWINETGYFVWEPPPYSTSIADAWLVVEKLSALGMSVQVSLEQNRPCCCLAIQKDGQIIGECADTAPLAICLAALKAVGDKERTDETD